MLLRLVLTLLLSALAACILPAHHAAAHGVTLELHHPLAADSARANAQLNGVSIQTLTRDATVGRAIDTDVVLAGALPKPPIADAPPAVQPYTHPLHEVYKYFLFHGTDLHGIEAVEGLSDTAFLGTAYPAPPPAWHNGNAAP